MRIDISSLKEGENVLHLEEDPAILDLSDELVPQGLVTLDGSVLRRGSRLVLHAAIALSLEAECSRCLAPFSVPINGFLETSYELGAEVTPYQKGSEVILIPGSEQSIDLTNQVREAIILAIPLKCLCHEECKGLCPRCGINLNRKSCNCAAPREDPRWTALEALRHETT